MNSMDARVIGASALTAAAVAMVTVVVYEGHVKVGKANQQTVVVAPGTTYKVNAVDTAPTVGASAQDRQAKVAVLGLQLVGDVVGDAPVVTQVLSASMRAVAAKEGPFTLAPGTDKELVDEKLLNNCANEGAQCMAAIGANLGVDVLVYGHIELSNKTYGVTVKLFDVTAKQIKNSETILMPVAEAEAEKLDEYARNLYLGVVGPASTVCDADALKDQGMENINMGQHAAALAKFEESLKCKADPYVQQLAFMESCASNNSAKAKHYYKLLTPAQQAKFQQMCIRNKVEFEDSVAAAPADCPGVDEVACVLNNYEGDCCKKYKPKPSKPDGLDRAAISAGIAKVKAKVSTCGDQPNPGGKLVARIVVDPDGSVGLVEIKSSPAPAVSSCVKAALATAKFAKTDNGGVFDYPFVFSAKADATCDAKALNEQGMENINMGQHAAALAVFDKSFRCKKDPYTVQLAFMEACASQNAPKAKQYYKQMTAAQQAKFAQICIRNKVDYQ